MEPSHLQGLEKAAFAAQLHEILRRPPRAVEDVQRAQHVLARLTQGVRRDAGGRERRLVVPARAEVVRRDGDGEVQRDAQGAISGHGGNARAVQVARVRGGVKAGHNRSLHLPRAGFRFLSRAVGHVARMRFSRGCAAAHARVRAPIACRGLDSLTLITLYDVDALFFRFRLAP